MIPLPTIHTPRLILRPVQKGDAGDIFDFARLPEVGPNAGWAPNKSVKDTEQFIKHAMRKRRTGQPGVFAVVYRKTSRVIGTIEVHSHLPRFKGEVGMVLHPEYWGNELMVEAGEAVIVYAFEHLELKRLGYTHYAGNHASKRLREKLGFVYEGLGRNFLKRFDGKVFDACLSALTDTDYYMRHRERFMKVKERIHFK